MTEELKPCPFCGHEAVTGFRGIGYSVHCNYAPCGILPRTEGFKRLKDAITAWNKRATS